MSRQTARKQVGCHKRNVVITQHTSTQQIMRYADIFLPNRGFITLIMLIQVNNRNIADRIHQRTPRLRASFLNNLTGLSLFPFRRDFKHRIMQNVRILSKA